MLLLAKIRTVRKYMDKKDLFSIIRAQKVSCLRVCLLIMLIFPAVLISEAIGQGKVDSCLRLLKEAPPPSDTDRVDLLNSIGRELYGSYPDSAKSYLERAKKLSNDLLYKKGLEESLNLLGIVEYVKSDHEAALAYWKKVLKKRRTDGTPSGIADIQNNLGLLYKKTGSYKKALQAHKEAAAIRDSIGNRQRMAQSQNNLGILYYELGELEKARGYYKKALEGYRAEGVKEDMGGLFNNLSLICRKNGAFERALKLGKKALEKDRANKVPRKVPNDLVNIGLVFKKMDKKDSAMQYYRAAEDLYRKIGNRGGLVTALTNIAGIRLDEGRYNEALSLSRKAYRIADSIGSPIKLKGASAYIAEASAALDKPWMAYRFQRTHDSISDSLLGKEKKKELAVMEGKYKMEKKKRELEREKAKRRKLELEKQEAEFRWMQTALFAGGGGILLLFTVLFLFLRYRDKRISNERLTEQKEELRKQKEEKELLFRELKHRVKNNLQLINSLLSLQERQIEDKELRTVLIESQNRIQSMGILHERIYNFEKMGSEDLEAFVQELTERLQESYGMKGVVGLETHMNSEGLGVIHFTPVALILNELISNALKYAFIERDRGHIWISLKPDNANYLLEVSDDGVGFQKDGDKGLGLDIVDSLVDQLEGRFERVEFEKGTSFRISFPGK